jgi:hypothetical protein
MKVCFLCGWGKYPTGLLSENKKFTAGNTGKFNSIIGCDNIKEADIICLLGNVHLSDAARNEIRNKTIIKFPREPFNNNEYDKIIHVVTTPSFINKTYDELVELKYPNKTNTLSFVVSNKNYPFRVKFVKDFAREHPGVADIYGYGWSNQLGKSYKGVLDGYHGKFNLNSAGRTKYSALYDYKYSICIENCSKYNYFSEKFTDAILCWCVPIYYGCPNISEYFPPGSYYYVDITKKGSFDEILRIISKPITAENVEALRRARELIINKYNVWAVLDDKATNS